MSVESKSADLQSPESTSVQAAAPGDARAMVSEVNLKFASWRQLKRPNEIQWFLNAAALRGLQNVKWNDVSARLETAPVPQYKVSQSINKILPKARQRKATYLKNTYAPIVIPASTDKEDKLNASASQIALEYAGRKTDLDSKYSSVVDWVVQTGKCFLWLYWDDKATANVSIGNNKSAPIQLGDIKLNVCTPFEILVPDLGVQKIGDQHEIMRVSAIPVEELKLMYSGVAGVDQLKGDTSTGELFQYQKQIASLSAKSVSGSTAGGAADKADKDLQHIVRKELVTRPCAKYPQGRYVVTAGTLVLKYLPFVPFNFQDMPNPFPCVEFNDIELGGQFWPTCIVEQLIGPQREYNDYRTKLRNHLQKCVHPKVITSVFSKWPENAWTDEAGEVIRIITPPGIMEPKVITPPAIAGDLWNGLKLIDQEIDQISSTPVLPSVGSQGNQNGGTTSGFQVNQLTENSEVVNAPDVKGHARAFQELYRKMRRIMKQGYQQPRLVSITGKAHIPDVVEFSSQTIDEQAEVIVYTGAALSNSPVVRTQQVIDLWTAGILQDPSNPAEAQRKVLTMLDVNGIGEFQEHSRADETKARLENLRLGRKQFVQPPLPFDNHIIHVQSHTDQMKSPEFESWTPEDQQEAFAHTLLHVKYINPQQAVVLAQELGMPQLIPILQPPPIQQQAPPPQPQEGGQESPAQQSSAPPPSQQAPATQ